MQVVIDIPEEEYELVRHGNKSYTTEAYKGRPLMLGNAGMDIISQAVANGTPLPEHHGRLIDADSVIAEATEGMKYPKNHTYMECVIAHINLAPTIIEGSHSEKWESAEENDSLIVDDLIDTSIPVRNCRECKHHVPAEGKEIFGCESWKCEFEKRGE